MKGNEKKYCKVCAHYDWKGYCQLGWIEFCNKENFEPSARDTILNFLLALYEADKLNTNILDEMEELIYKWNI